MRYIFVLAVFVFIISIDSYAQTNQEGKVETLLGSDDIKNGGFIAPELKVGQVKDKPALILGGKLGWIINGSFSVGGAGYGIVTSHDLKDYKMSEIYPNINEYDSTVKITGGWGGLFFEYIYKPNKVIHFTADLMLGMGGVSLSLFKKSNISVNEADSKSMSLESSSFFLVEPRLMAEFNIFKFFRIGAGVSYRIISGLELQALSNSDFNGFNGNLCLKFGFF